jgi:hypothetical protein
MSHVLRVDDIWQPDHKRRSNTTQMVYQVKHTRNSNRGSALHSLNPFGSKGNITGSSLLQANSLVSFDKMHLLLAVNVRDDLREKDRPYQLI